LAEQTLRVDITWENGVKVECQTQLNGGAAKTVLLLEEDGHLATLWPYAESTIVSFLQAHLTAIGNEMKS
jgi:hypothetical protein